AVHSRPAGGPRGSALFLTHRAEPMTTGAVRRPFRKIRQEVGIDKRVTVHTLRPTCLTLLMEAGVDIRTIQELALHASLHTTLLYTHLAQGRKVDAAMKHPFA